MNGDNAYNFENFLIAFMFVDMLINANIAYIHKGNIIRKRELTVIKYVKTYFFIDFVIFF